MRAVKILVYNWNWPSQNIARECIKHEVRGWGIEESPGEMVSFQLFVQMEQSISHIVPNHFYFWNTYFYL